MIEYLKKDLDNLQQFKDTIRRIPSNEFDCETVLDLLNPIIQEKEELFVKEHSKLRKIHEEAK
jgi:hypothetical protein|tara:strand:- start:252 stop:440 length:189 start_codon:yes stop_codon:yes gene_type:complete